MNLIRCINGHFFDNDKYSSCPYCKTTDTLFTPPVSPAFPEPPKLPVPFPEFDKLMDEDEGGPEILSEIPLSKTGDIPLEHVYKADIKSIIIYKTGAKVLATFEIIPDCKEMDIFIADLPRINKTDSINIKGNGVIIDSTSQIGYRPEDSEEDNKIEKLEEERVHLVSEEDFILKELESIQLFLKKSTSDVENIEEFLKIADSAKESYNKLGRNLYEIRNQLHRVSDEIEAQKNKRIRSILGIKAHVYFDKIEKKEVTIEYVDDSIRWKSSYSLFASQENNEVRIDYIAKIISMSRKKVENVNITLSTGINNSWKIPKINRFVLSKNIKDVGENFDTPAISYGGIMRKPSNPQKHPDTTVFLENKNTVSNSDGDTIDLKDTGFTPDIETDTFTNSIEYLLKSPLSIEFNSSQNVVLSSNIVTIEKKYFAIPAESKNVFTRLEALNLNRLFDKDSRNSEVKIYYDGEYIRNTTVESIEKDEGITLSFIDGISVTKTVIDSKKTRNPLNGVMSLYTKYAISIDNKLAQEISVDVYDNIPVSEDKEITVKIIKSCDAKLDPCTGIARWNVIMRPNTKAVFEVEYSIHYPDKIPVIRRK